MIQVVVARARHHHHTIGVGCGVNRIAQGIGVGIAAQGNIDDPGSLLSGIQHSRRDVRVVGRAGSLHDLDPETLKKIGKVDILFLPVGGFYTIDAQAATKVMNNIRPSITIPMHYKTEKCSFPITTVAEFTRGKKNVQVLPKSDMKITAAALPKEPEIIVLQHSQ